MNAIVNKCLLAGDKFMPDMHLRQPGLLIRRTVHSQNTKKEFKDLCKQEIQTTSTGMNWIKLVLLMMQLMMTKLMKSQTIQNMMDIKEDEPVWCISFVTRNQKELVLEKISN